MSKTSSFRTLHHLLGLAFESERTGIQGGELVQRSRDARRIHLSKGTSRRQFLVESSRLAALAAGASALGSAGALSAAAGRGNLSVGIVGAGLAGLACADELRTKRIQAAIYEASDRVGGRCWSLRNFFPGQVAERGGELIDNPHKTMLGYARRFGLAVEDVSKVPGEVFYHFNGQAYSEAAVVDEFRSFVDVMRQDLRRLSGEVTALEFTPDDRAIDRTSLADYLDGANGLGEAASPLVRAVIVEAYEAEYGLEAEEQSCLNFLMFIHADRRAKFRPFGSSDERWHVLDGNDRIATGLAASLNSPVSSGMALVAVQATPAGRIELTFVNGRRTVTRVHDTVVIALPFSVLRNVDLDENLNLRPEQRAAIEGFGYGTNAKMMVGFRGRPWIASGSNGTAYSDLPNVQTVWETNPAASSSSRGILTDYASGKRGAELDPGRLQNEVARFLSDLNVIYPGALAAAVLTRNRYLAHLEPWPSNPFSLGSYTCYKPGQFTTMAGFEGMSAGPLHFAGEHANSFYVWQGFMEGAALSGIDAASYVLAMA